jgi:hypothetical protein
MTVAAPRKNSVQVNVNAITDQPMLVDIALTDQDWRAREEAAKKITDQ